MGYCNVPIAEDFSIRHMIVPGFRYIGYVDTHMSSSEFTEIRQDGDVCTDLSDGHNYVYCSGTWANLGESGEETNEEYTKKDIATTTCEHCGAPLDIVDNIKNGLCKCSYCNGQTYVLFRKENK